MKMSLIHGEMGAAGMVPQLRFDELEIESYHDGVVAIDFEMRVIAANQTARHALPGNWNGQYPLPLDDIFPAAADELKWFGQMVNERICFRNKILTFTRHGRTATLLADSSLLRDGDGELAGICLFLKDIGTIVSLEQQIQHNEKLATLGKIAAGIAHEIRNPLTSIKGFLQIMRCNLLEKGMNQEHSYTDVMLTEIERVNSLVSELLLLSKPRELKIETLEVEELLMALTPLISSEALLHNVEVDLSLQPVPPIFADRETIKQVFLNLIKNGIEAMSENGGGRLEIRTGYVADEGMVRIDIKDTGLGIPHYMMDRIFDAFFTTKETGTGLGLPICQRLVNDLGGTIKVTSKGYGTTFSVWLPGS